MLTHWRSNAIRKRGYSGDVYRAAKRLAVHPATGAAAALAVGRYKGGGSTAKAGTHGSGVSLQRDRQVQYVPRHKPGWKSRARKIRKFNGRVKACLLKNLGKLTSIMDDFIAPTSSAGTQLRAFVTLGAMYGNGTGEQDINQIIVAANANSSDAGRIIIDHMVLDMQITTTEATESSCELDVYEFVCRKDVPNTIQASGTVGDVNMSNFFDKGLSSQPAVGTGGTVLTATTLGVTPFDNKYWCQHFKIVKKTKFLLGLNQYATYQIRIPGNKTISAYQRRDLLARKGLTRGVMFIAKGLVTGGAVPSTDLAVYTQRHYKYAILQGGNDAAETR